MKAPAAAARADGDAAPLVHLPDGRRLGYRVWGDPGGRAVLALHGTPGSRLKFSAADEAARRLGLAIVAPDRWGYGASDPHPEPSLAGFARDMRWLAQELRLGRFAVMGVSGGGPYAVAVAAGLPDRVAALALVAPVGPIAREPGTDLSRFHRLCFGPLARSPLAIGLVFGGFRRLLGWSPRLGMRVAMARVPSADRATLASPGVEERLAATFAEGLRAGVAGPVIDLSLFGRPWDLPLADATAPARMWLGSNDRNVPLPAARRLADRLPACSVVELPGEGHLWVARNYATVLGWIAEPRRDRPSGLTAGRET